MLEDVKKAWITNATGLIEVSLKALEKIKVMNLEPDERADLQSAFTKLESVADRLRPRSVQSPIS